MQFVIFNSFKEAKETWLDIERGAGNYGFQHYNWLLEWYEQVAIKQ